MLGQFLPVLAATDASGAVNGSSASSAEKLTSFPGESPLDQVLRYWLKINLPRMRMKFGALLRGETPLHLLALKAGAAADLREYVRINATEARTENLNKAALHTLF